MNYGVTADGFVPKRFTDIRQEIEASILGKWPDADLSDESVFGQLVTIFSYAHAEEWEVLQNIYNMQSIYSAEGVSLDDASANMGIYRLPSTASIVEVLLIRSGSSAVLVPEGTVFANNNHQFVLSDDTTIQYSGIKVAGFQLKDLPATPDGTWYGVTLDGADYEVKFDSALPTAEDLIYALSLLLSDFDPSYLSSYLTIRSANGLEFSTYKRSDVSVKTLWPPEWAWGVVGSAVCGVTGFISAPALTVTTIVTPVAGLSRVVNPAEASEGRDNETDFEFRLRIEQNRQLSGAATLPAITSRILAEVPGVTSVKGFENRDSVTDADGLPAHSFEMAIIGGDPLMIAEKIWELKPAGIQTHGNTSQVINDLNGDPQLIKFSRPTTKLVWAKITAYLSGEEAFPTSGTIAIRDAVYAYGTSIPAGNDAYAVHFIPAVLSVPGIGNVSVELSSDGVAWTSNKVVVTGSDAVTMLNDKTHILITIS